MKQFIKNNLHILLALVVIAVFVIFRFGPKTQTGSSKIASSAAEIQKDCNGSTDVDAKLGWENCYAKKFRALAKQVGPIQAFDQLHELQSMDKRAYGCHLIGHGIGWGTFESKPSDWQKDIQIMPSECNYGAIHGVIEGYLGSQPDHTLNKANIASFCGPTPRADCNHIMGHLTLVETRGKIDDALDICDTFAGDKTQLDFCYTGVFMEEETAINLVDHGYADKSYLDWPKRLPTLTTMCLTYSGEKGQACWKEIVHVIATSFNNNPSQVFKYCDKNPDPIAIEECKRHGIGIMAASKNFDLQALKPMCDLVQEHYPDFKSDCYVQLAASTLSTIPDQARVKKFCEGLEQQFQSACFGQISGYNKYNQKTTD